MQDVVIDKVYQFIRFYKACNLNLSDKNDKAPISFNDREIMFLV